MPLTFITGLYGMNVDLPHFGLGGHHVLGADGVMTAIVGRCCSLPQRGWI
jgi:Mg2+ and Co2+ transporter CorA